MEKNLGSGIRRFLAALLLVLPGPLQACWMTPQEPTKIINDHVKIRFTFAGKPLSGARVGLTGKSGSVVRAITNRDGWATFSKVAKGNYKVTFAGPSRESFEVAVEPQPWNRTVMYVAFYDDYCYQTQTVRE